MSESLVFGERPERFAHLLFYHEQPEQFAYSHSFVLSDLSDSLTVDHLS